MPTARVIDDSGNFLLDSSDNNIVTYTYTGLDLGLVAHWKLDETSGTTLADSSGNGYDLTTSGSPTLGGGGAASGTGTSVAFNGSTQYASYTGLINMPVYPFTVSGWIKKTSLSTQVEFFELWSSTNNYFRLQARTGGGLRVVRYDGTSSEFGAVTPTGIVTAGEWLHIAMVLASPTEIYWYANGSSVYHSAALSSNIQATFTNIYLGRSYSSYWNGSLDDFRLYNRALSSNEVTQLYNTAIATASDSNNSLTVGLHVGI